MYIFLTQSKYAKLMCISKEAVRLQVINNKLPEQVKIVKIKRRKYYYIDNPKLNKLLSCCDAYTK
jgi:hypothetical protein